MTSLPIILCACLLLVAKSHAQHGAVVAEEIPLHPKVQNNVAITYSTAPVAGIPKEWVELQGLDVLRYANYIKSLNLKNVDPYKVLHPHFKTRGRTNNSLPPRDSWENIAQTLKVVDLLSTSLDAEVAPFISAYRTSEYNRAVRGKADSQHLKNRAVSIQFVGIPPKEVAAAAMKLRSKGIFKGGIGNYERCTDIDTGGANVDLTQVE